MASAKAASVLGAMYEGEPVNGQGANLLTYAILKLLAAGGTDMGGSRVDDVLTQLQTALGTTESYVYQQVARHLNSLREKDLRT